MSLRRQAATALAAYLGARLALAKPVTVINAPPSEVAEYPAMAIWLEKFELDIHQDEEIQQDPDGNPLVGATLSIDALQDSVTAMLDAKMALGRVGTMKGSGRIWIGARHAAKREELEDETLLAFFGDRGAPGRILLPLRDLRVGGLSLPWEWTVAAFVDSSEWTAEFAFSERVWSWLRFDLDVDMLVPRSEPIIRTLQLLFTQDVDTKVETPADIATLKNLEQYDVDADGDVTRVTS